jgi:hypothetical protein
MTTLTFYRPAVPCVQTVGLISSKITDRWSAKGAGYEGHEEKIMYAVPDQAGKLAVVTGANSGTGREAAQRLAGPGRTW